jgi:hypothetical protein
MTVTELLGIILLFFLHILGSPSLLVSPVGMQHKKEDGAHYFYPTSFARTTACNVCHKPLRGLAKQGLACSICQYAVHYSCEEKSEHCCPITYSRPSSLEVRSSTHTHTPHTHKQQQQQHSASCALMRRVRSCVVCRVSCA